MFSKTIIYAYDLLIKLYNKFKLYVFTFLYKFISIKNSFQISKRHYYDKLKSSL